MDDFIEINSLISLLTSSENPLSANVFFIKGKNKTYIFDVGSNLRSKELINNIKSKAIIISHFHQDHFKNISEINIDDKNLYLGNYSYKVLGHGTLVDKIIEFNDEINIQIIPLPNSHSKGALALLVDNAFLLVGDALEGSKDGYNVSLLFDEIKLLRELDYTYIIASHDSIIRPKDDVIKYLEDIYSKRVKSVPYISYDLL